MGCDRYMEDNGPSGMERMRKKNAALRARVKQLEKDVEHLDKELQKASFEIAKMMLAAGLPNSTQEEADAAVDAAGGDPHMFVQAQFNSLRKQLENR